MNERKLLSLLRQALKILNATQRKAFNTEDRFLFREFYFGCSSRHLCPIDQLNRTPGCKQSQKFWARGIF